MATCPRSLSQGLQRQSRSGPALPRHQPGQGLSFRGLNPCRPPRDGRHPVRSGEEPRLAGSEGGSLVQASVGRISGSPAEASRAAFLNDSNSGAGCSPVIAFPPPEGVSRPGEGSSRLREGSSPLREGAARPGEGSSAPGEGAWLLPEGAMAPGEGATKSREGSAGPREGDSGPPEGAAREKDPKDIKDCRDKERTALSLMSLQSFGSFPGPISCGTVSLFTDS